MPPRPVLFPVPREMSEGALNVWMSNSPNTKADDTMIDCGRPEMGQTHLCETHSADCVIAVTETRNVTARLGHAELRALRVLAEAGLVPPSAQVFTNSA